MPSAEVYNSKNDVKSLNEGHECLIIRGYMPAGLVSLFC